jgi:hypothetical protein
LSLCCLYIKKMAPPAYPARANHSTPTRMQEECISCLPQS